MAISDFQDLVDDLVRDGLARRSDGGVRLP